MQESGKEELSEKKNEFHLLANCITKLFYRIILHIKADSKKAEMHEFQGIIAQGDSSFPLSGTILEGRLDTTQ